MASELDVLNDLIAVCRESEEGFGRAALAARTSELRLRFTTAARYRADFADELTAQLQIDGGHPHQRARREPDMHVEMQDDPIVLAACERAEENTLGQYERALTLELTPLARAIVERHRLAVQEALFELRNLQSVQKAG